MFFTHSLPEFNHSVINSGCYGIKFVSINKKQIMDTTQAVIILKRGHKKYGLILDGTSTHEIQFISGTKLNAKENPVIEFIPLEEIASIDTYFK